jgi:hypothetical protein
MGGGFTFYDYIDADGDGTNLISSWLNGDGRDAKAYFATIMPLLEASSPPGFVDTFWREPYAKLMKNKRGQRWRGFIELRKEIKNIQYRLLGQMQSRSVFLVAHGIHKGQNYTTDVSPQTALNRVEQMKNNLAKYGREHEYN